MKGKIQHQLSVGLLKNGELVFEKQIGVATFVNSEDCPYYKLEIWQYPGRHYYLVKNKEGTSFTVFSGISDEYEYGGVVYLDFKSPVGCGFITRKLKEFIQIQFNFPRQMCFLSLHPDNSLTTEREAA